MGTKQPGSFTGMQSAFPGPQGVQVAGKFSTAYNLLKKNNITAAWERLDRLDDDVRSYAPSLDLLRRYIPNNEVFIEDIEEASAGRVRRFNLARTIFALAPLLLTWATLAWATGAYQGEPAQSSNTVQTIQSFLAQWQNGFGNTGSLFKFSNVALFDAFLIIGVVAFTVCVHLAETRPKQIIQTVEPVVDQALRSLLIAVEQKGALDPKDMQNLVKLSAGMINDAVVDLKSAALDWKNTATKTEKNLAELAIESKALLETLGKEVNANLQKTEAGIQKVLATLEKEIQQTIRNEMGTILKDYQATLKDFQEQVTQYKAASTELVGEAKKLSEAGDKLANEAKAYTAIAGEIKTHSVELRDSQKEFVGKVSGIATDMGTAAANTTRLVDRIDKTLQPELKILVDKAADTSEALTKASQALAVTNSHLTGTTTNLRAASGDLQSALSRIPGSLAGSGSGGGGRSRWLGFSNLINLGILLVLLALLGLSLIRGTSPTQPTLPTATPTTPTPTPTLIQ